MATVRIVKPSKAELGKKPCASHRLSREQVEDGKSHLEICIKMDIDLPFMGQKTRPRECGARTDFSKRAAKDLGD